MRRSSVFAPCRRIAGSIKVPGDKSISHRALIVAMINQGAARIEGLVPAADVLSTLDAVDALGGCNLRAQLELEFHDGIPSGRDFQVLVDSEGWDALTAPSKPIDVGNSGTTIRLLTGILAGSRINATLTGDESIRRRPMRRVTDPLSRMGARISVYGPTGTAPIRIEGTALHGAEHALPIASAQVKSALIFAGLRANGTTVITEPHPSRDHTERLLRELDADVEEDEGMLTVKSTHLQSDWSMNIPGDLSSAAFLLAAAALRPGSEITVEDVGLNPTRTGILEVLAEYGSTIVIDDEREVCGEPVGTLTVIGAERRPLTVEGPLTVRTIDELPLVAVLGAFAEGETIVRNAEELRVKESDRIATICAALSALGADIAATPDGFSVTGRGGIGIAGGRVDAHGDHRIAMAAAVAGISAGEGETVVDGWESVSVSYPWFAEDLESLAVR